MKKILNNYSDYICYLLVTGVFLYVIISYNNLYNQNIRQSIELKEYSEQYEKNTMAIDLLLDNLSMTYENDDKSFPNFKLVDVNKNKIELKDLLYEKEYKLVFFFSYLNCESCIDSALDNLVTIGREMNMKNNMLVICEFANMRAMKAFMDNHPFDIPMYFNIDSVKNNILENENVPFFCVMNKKLVAKHILIPIKEIPKQTRRYLNCIQKRYFAK